VEVVKGFLEPMVRLFQKERTGMVSPKIIYFQRGEQIQYAGSHGINPWTGRGKKDGQLKVDQGQYDFVRETELVHGACMMVSRALVEEVGMFDESFFIYYEEHDWAVRAKLKGFKLYYTGESKIYHKESITTGKESPFKTYFMAKNRILFLKRNVPYPARFISLFVFFFAAVPKKIVKSLLIADFKNISALLRGILWHVGV
jgi:GT2 family glycosyltransferase